MPFGKSLSTGKGLAIGSISEWRESVAWSGRQSGSHPWREITLANMGATRMVEFEPQSHPPAVATPGGGNRGRVPTGCWLCNRSGDRRQIGDVQALTPKGEYLFQIA